MYRQQFAKTSPENWTQTLILTEDTSTLNVQMIWFKLMDAPRQGFHLLLLLHLQVKKVKSDESDWGWNRLWVAIRDTLSMLCHLDMSEGESSHQSGWCEKARPGRLTECSGPGWYLVPRRQSSGRLRVRAASCEAICSERADRRRMQHRDVLYTLSKEAQAVRLYLKLVVTLSI